MTSDILFLQKRDALSSEEPDWVHLNTDANGLKMNQYFIDHSEMVMGEMREISGPYGPETACLPIEGRDLEDQLAVAIQSIQGSITEYVMDDPETEGEDKSIPADPEVRNFSYTIVDGKVYYRENSRMNPIEVSVTAANRIKGLIGIRDCVRTLIEYQTEDWPDQDIQAQQRKLNALYDAFVDKYGRINSRANSSAFSMDSAYFLLTSLEVLDDERNFVRKADMVDGYGENNPIVVKSQFIMSLVERIDPKGVGPQHNSIIDRCTGDLYEEAEQNDTVPTLAALREKLMEQPEAEAREIALALELFTTGSLDIFGHDSTVDLDKRVVVFDIHGLGEQLKPIGHLVITDTMLNRVTLNWKKGRRTHVFIDEFHVMFENEFSAAFFNSAWRQFRKRNAYPTAITQNVEYLLDSVQASTMLSNSEFIVMLNQAAGDREKLAHLLNISEEQMSYITNADAGCGLIKYGSALVPFVNRFPHNTELYRLMTTRPGEGCFSGGRA